MTKGSLECTEGLLVAQNKSTTPNPLKGAFQCARDEHFYAVSPFPSERG
jgi:hypothetical protein